jgi:hypothetical protein
MTRKHKRNTVVLSAKPQADDAAMAKSGFRRKMLYGLIALSAGVIAVGVYSLQPAPAPTEARAATVPSGQPSAGKLASDAPFYNFGTVSMAAGKVMRRFTIGNVGQAPLTITKLSTSCMCTDATLVTSSVRRGPFGMPGHMPIPSIRERLAPGEMAQVEVVFDPAAHGPAGIGRTDRTVTIENDAGTPLQLNFTAMVRP